MGPTSPAPWREWGWQWEIAGEVAISAECGCTDVLWFLQVDPIPAPSTPMNGILVAELHDIVVASSLNCRCLGLHMLVHRARLLAVLQ